MHSTALHLQNRQETINVREVELYNRERSLLGKEAVLYGRGGRSLAMQLRVAARSISPEGLRALQKAERQRERSEARGWTAPQSFGGEAGGLGRTEPVLRPGTTPHATARVGGAGAPVSAWGPEGSGGGEEGDADGKGSKRGTSSPSAGEEAGQLSVDQAILWSGGPGMADSEGAGLGGARAKYVDNSNGPSWGGIGSLAPRGGHETMPIWRRVDPETLWNEYEKKNKEVEDVKVQLKRARNGMVWAQTQEEAAQEREAAANRSVDRLKGQLSDMEDAMAEKQVECNAFRDQGLQLEAAVAAMRVAEEDSRVRERELSAECERLRAGVRAEELAGQRRLEEHKARLQQEAAARALADERVAELEAAAEELNVTAGQVGPLEEANHVLRRDLASCAREMHKASEELEDAQEKLEALQDKVQMIQGGPARPQIDRLVHQLAAARARCDKYNRKLESAREEIKETHEQLVAVCVEDEDEIREAKDQQQKLVAAKEVRPDDSRVLFLFGGVSAVSGDARS